MIPVGNYWRHFSIPAPPRSSSIQGLQQNQTSWPTPGASVGWLMVSWRGVPFIAGDAFSMADICARPPPVDLRRLDRPAYRPRAERTCSPGTSGYRPGRRLRLRLERPFSFSPVVGRRGVGQDRADPCSAPARARAPVRRRPRDQSRTPLTSPGATTGASRGVTSTPLRKARAASRSASSAGIGSQTWGERGAPGRLHGRPKRSGGRDPGGPRSHRGSARRQCRPSRPRPIARTPTPPGREDCSPSP